MTDELLPFLRTRLDEDDATARAASWDEWDGSHWTAHHREQYDGRWVIIDRADEGVTDVNPQAADDAGVAQHIALHDPARVLREVEARGQMIDLHGPVQRRSTGSGGGFTECCGICDHFPAQYPCATLRLLALPYADHPDYRPEWRP